MLHQDNPPAHKALSVKQFLAHNQIPILEHPPYSSDLAPCEFYLFLKGEMRVEGNPFSVSGGGEDENSGPVKKPDSR